MSASLILTHGADGTYPGPQGLSARRAAARDADVFFAFRIMVGIGLLLIAVGFVGRVLWWRGRLFDGALYPARVSTHAGRSASSPSSPAGSSPRPAVSPGSCTASCAPPTASSPVPGAQRCRHRSSLFVRRLRGRLLDRRLLHQPPHRRRPAGRGDRRADGLPNGRFRQPRKPPARQPAAPPARAGQPLTHAGVTAMELVSARCIWAALIGTAVAMYVVLDGFDLGIGILFPFTRDGGERDVMMNSVAPFWDGNETWLVLGGAGLWVAFPHGLRDRSCRRSICRSSSCCWRWCCAASRSNFAGWRSRPSQVGHRLRRRLDRRGLPAGRHPRRPARRASRVVDRPVRRRPFRLADAVLRLRAASRWSPATRCSARAGSMMKTRPTSQDLRRAACADRCSCCVLACDGRRQPVDAAGDRRASPSAGSRWPNIFYSGRCRCAPRSSATLVWRRHAARSEYAPFFGTIGLFVLGYLGLVDLDWFPISCRRI